LRLDFGLTSFEDALPLADQTKTDSRDPIGFELPLIKAYLKLPLQLRKMGDHDLLATCMSSIEHHRNVSDILAHYFGCLRQNKRGDYFNSLLPDQQTRIVEEERRIRELRSLFNSDPEGTNGLAQRLKISLNNWRGSMGMSMPLREYSYEDRAVSKPCKENCFGMNANMLFFKTMGPLTDPEFAGQFPNQEIPLKDLLYNKSPSANPLMKNCRRDEVRYFHIPANNMEWIEVCMLGSLFKSSLKL
jgi:hypothetical protein